MLAQYAACATVGALRLQFLQFTSYHSVGAATRVLHANRHPIPENRIAIGPGVMGHKTLKVAGRDVYGYALLDEPVMR